MCEITPIEQACGVTVEQVRATRRKALVLAGQVYLPAGTPPALCVATARAALGVQWPMFVGINVLGYPTYSASMIDGVEPC